MAEHPAPAGAGTLAAMAEHPGRELANRIGRVGLWSYFDYLPARDAQAAARELEGMGFGAIWLPEFLGKEIFSDAAIVLAGAERIVVASGIANIWARDAMAMANGARGLAEAFPGRFVLGLGVSHELTVDRRGGHYERPLAKMREYLDAMAKARYLGPKPEAEPPIVLAALGPRMLALAARRTAGAHPYFVPVEHTAAARATLGEGPLLAVEQAVLLERDPARARATAREHTAPYLRLPSYANNLKRLGWAEADLEGGGSDAVVDAIVAHGGPDEIAARVRAHLDAGADHVCIQPLGGARATSPVPALRELTGLLAL